MQVTVEIPDEFLDSLVPAGQDAARALLEDSVAAAYRERRIGPRQVSILLGFETSIEVMDFLQRHDVWGYTIDDFDKDAANLEKLRISRGLQQTA